MAEPIDYGFIVDLIDAGECDDIMELLTDAVSARRQYLKDMRGAMNKATFVPGTHVRLVNISPRYLIGITGVVVAQTPKRPGDLMVEIDDLYYSRIRHRFGKVLGCPASSLELV
jgi:hypothetical protein